MKILKMEIILRVFLLELKNEQLPKLLHQPLYRKQLEEHIAELKEQSDQMNTDLQKYVQSDLEAQEKIDAVASKFEEMLKVPA